MIDFEEALASQRDLETLCTGPVDAGPEEREMHNAGYGFARILKEYAGYPLDSPVEAVIPHGVYIDAAQMLRYELEAPVPAVLNYPAFRAELWCASSDKEVVPSASPVLYALEMFRERFADTAPPREGTLFFTPHRDGSMNVASDYTPLIRALRGLDARFQPVTVCVSIIDYRKGDHLPFREAGFQVVCAGQPEDQEFTFRWLHLLSRHRYAAGTRLGGYLFYAVAAGTPFFLVDAPELRRWNVAAFLASGRPSPQVRQTRDAITGMFSQENLAEDIAPEAAELVGYLLGAENLKTPEGLRADLEYVAELSC